MISSSRAALREEINTVAPQRRKWSLSAWQRGSVPQKWFLGVVCVSSSDLWTRELTGQWWKTLDKHRTGLSTQHEITQSFDLEMCSVGLECVQVSE